MSSSTSSPTSPRARVRNVARTCALLAIASVLGGCAVIGATAAVGGLAVDAAVGTVRLTGKAVGAAVNAVTPDADK
jgi:hypothetical protein